MPTIPSPGPVAPPTGRRPRGTNDNAPLPKLGPLISGLLKAIPQRPAQLQAAVTPVPPVPGAAAPKSPNANQAVPEAVPVPPSPPPAGIAGAPTSLVEYVTGPNSPNRTLERFGISGTDLGIPWDNGDPANRQVLMAFGDTFGYCAVHGQQWRYNVLFRSQDHDLSHGIHVADGVPNNPYSGSPVWAPGPVQAGAQQHSQGGARDRHHPDVRALARAHPVHELHVDQELGPRRRVVDELLGNRALVGQRSDRGGSTPAASAWPVRTPCPADALSPVTRTSRWPRSCAARTAICTRSERPSGRSGAAFLSRVQPNALPDVGKYQYWNGEGRGWVPADPGAATPIFPGPVGEMSAQYNDYLKQYLVLYTNGGNNDVIARTAPAPEGPWSPEQPLVSSFQMPGGIYAPMIHPWSNGKDLYFNLSLWSAYDVMLMHTVLP